MSEIPNELNHDKSNEALSREKMEDLEAGQYNQDKLKNLDAFDSNYAGKLIREEQHRVTFKSFFSFLFFFPETRYDEDEAKVEKMKCQQLLINRSREL